MALNYIPFYTHIWSDKNFKKLKDNDNRILFIYLFGNPQVTLTGIYSLDLDICKLKAKTLRNFDEVFKENVDSGMIKWDNKSDTIFIINRFKFIPNKSAKIIQGVISELNMINHQFKDDFVKIYNDYFGNYKPILKDYEDKEFNLLTTEQIKSWVTLGWQKPRIKKFYMDRNYTEQKIDEVINQHFPHLI